MKIVHFLPLHDKLILYNIWFIQKKGLFNIYLEMKKKVANINVIKKQNKTTIQIILFSNCKYTSIELSFSFLLIIKTIK